MTSSSSFIINIAEKKRKKLKEKKIDVPFESWREIRANRNRQYLENRKAMEPFIHTELKQESCAFYSHEKEAEDAVNKRLAKIEKRVEELANSRIDYWDTNARIDYLERTIKDTWDHFRKTERELQQEMIERQDALRVLLETNKKTS